MHHTSSVLLLLGLAACYSGPGSATPSAEDQAPAPTPTHETKSGTRLLNRYAMADDGARIPLGIFDTRLNTECVFSEAEDGKQRCLPAAMASITPPEFLNAATGGAEALYRDNACTDRVAFSSLCQPPAQYIRYSDTCGSRTRIAQAVEFSLPPALYQRSNNGSCGMVSTSYVYFKQQRLYSFGSAVAPDEFVAAVVMLH